MALGSGLTEQNPVDLHKLARQGEAAFASTAAPQAEPLTVETWDPDADKMDEQFSRRHSSAVPLQTIRQFRSELMLFTPEAFHFYLPAFLIVALLYGDETDSLAESLFFFLTPQQGSGEDSGWFDAVLAKLTPEQRQAVARFMLWFISAFPYYSAEVKKRALGFWRPMLEA